MDRLLNGGHMRLSSIVEGWKYLHLKRQGTTDAIHSPNQPLLQLLLDNGGLAESSLSWAPGQDAGVFRPREEVDNIHDAFFMDVPGLQNIGRRQILLFGGAVQSPFRLYAEIASLILVEKPTEYGRRVKVRPIAKIRHKD
jgi:hypothetical protein